MKKITSKEPISFRYDGTTVLDIGPEGCITHDAAAALAKDRLGDHVTVEDVAGKKDKPAADDASGEPTLADLKKQAKDLGLAVSGSKDDLAARIAEHTAALAKDASGDVPVAGDGAA